MMRGRGHDTRVCVRVVGLAVSKGTCLVSHAHTHTQAHRCTFIHTSMHTYTHANTCTHTQTNTCTHTQTNTCTYIHTHKHTYTLTTHVHTHGHTCTDHELTPCIPYLSYSSTGSTPNLITKIGIGKFISAWVCCPHSVHVWDTSCLNVPQCAW